jgi:hypothetical protein
MRPTLPSQGDSIMKRFVGLAIAVGLEVFGSAAFAQITPLTPPALENRIPAPLPPPVRPPVINGPLRRGGDPSPKMYNPPQLDTFGDRFTNCLHRGAAYGMNGQRLNSYATTCGNSK